MGVMESYRIQFTDLAALLFLMFYLCLFLMIEYVSIVLLFDNQDEFYTDHRLSKVV